MKRDLHHSLVEEAVSKTHQFEALIKGTILTARSEKGLLPSIMAVPEAVSVIGHDNIPTAELSIPPLTTVDFDSPDLTERLIES